MPLVSLMLMLMLLLDDEVVVAPPFQPVHCSSDSEEEKNVEVKWKA